MLTGVRFSSAKLAFLLQEVSIWLLKIPFCKNKGASHFGKELVTIYIVVMPSWDVRAEASSGSSWLNSIQV